MTSSEVHESGLDMSHPVFKTLQPLVEALGCSVVDASLIEPADIPLVYEGELIAVVRLPDLHGALERLIDAVDHVSIQPRRTIASSFLFSAKFMSTNREWAESFQSVENQVLT